MHDIIALFQIGEINVQRGTRRQCVRRFLAARPLDFVTAKNLRVSDDDNFCRFTNETARQRPDLRISALGSGSDYSPFIDHLGVAALNLGFSGEDQGGIYHSVYDDFYWYTHFQDTDFSYGRALAQTAGTIMMRLADSGVIAINP